MLLPIKWLKQFVEVSESPEQVVERFIELGFESEVKPGEIIDLEITPNRGDVLSILGLAREYAASTGQTVKLPATAQLTDGQLTDFTITADPKAYHRISATVIKDVHVQPSPVWLKEALESVGMNSINTVVDLTNYVMFEFGIPMHAFDIDQLPEKTFNVRLSSQGEQFLSLKDESVELPENSIVVESGGQIVDLLGIRGGKLSMIQDSTKNILVWGVSVPRPLIRQTVKKTGIRTEGAYRHERETDWQMTSPAVARFVELLSQLGSGNTAELMTLQATEQPIKQISFKSAHINRLLGTNYSEDEMMSALTALGFIVEAELVTVPSWRYFDINFEEDLIEEIARIQGYTKLPRKVIEKTAGSPDTSYGQTENLKDQLVAAGLVEVYTESFSGRDDGKALGWNETDLDILANPVNHDFAYCRPVIMPHLVRLLTLNSWSDDARVFEIGNVFPTKEAEETHLAIAAYGNQQKLLEQWLPTEAIQLIMPDHPLAKLHKLRRLVIVGELNISIEQSKGGSDFIIPVGKPNYRSVSVFPPSVRDIAVVVGTDIDLHTITATVADIAPERIVIVELFDQFTTDKFGPNKQSLAFHIVYQDLNKTLEAVEVDSIHQQVINTLQEKFAAEIR